MKSIEARFAEAVEAVKKAGRTKQFDEKVKDCTTIEAKFACAEAVLKDAGVVRTKESTSLLESAIQRLSHEQYQVFSNRLGNKRMSEEEQLALAEAILKGEIKETATPIRKHNGASENFVEGNPFRHTVEEFSPGYIKENTDPCAKGDKVMFDCLLKAGKITEAEHRKLTGAKPEGYDKLSEQQRKDFDFARTIGLSEADAFKVVNITGSTFREVSRR